MSLPAAVVLRQQEIDDLETEVSVVAARLNRAHADLVDLTRRVLEEERWGGSGIRSPEHWLVLHAGLSPARAADVVRLARRSTELPTTVAAMVAGQVSVDQAAVVARYAPSSHEASIGELAPMTTVPQLRRALSRYQFGSEASGPSGETGRDERDVPGTEAFAAKAPELSMSYGDGRFLLRYSAPADIGALVEQAVREAKDALFTSGQTGASYADGLAELASRSLASVQSGSRAARYRVYVHLVHRRFVGRRAWCHPGLVGGEVRVRRGRPTGVGGRRHAGQRGSRAADRAQADSPPGRGPRPGLRLPGLSGDRVPRDPPPRPLGRRRRHRPRPAGRPVPACTTTPTTAASSPSVAARSIPTGWFKGLLVPLRVWSSPTLAAGSSAFPSAPSSPRPSPRSRSSTHTEDRPVSGCRPAGWTCPPTDRH